MGLKPSPRPLCIVQNVRAACRPAPAVTEPTCPSLRCTLDAPNPRRVIPTRCVSPRDDVGNFDLSCHRPLPPLVPAAKSVDGEQSVCRARPTEGATLRWILGEVAAISECTDLPEVKPRRMPARRNLAFDHRRCEATCRSK